MTAHLPLSTLLSQVLVAFTIEFDNAFEHQMPHRTTNHGSTAGSRQGPWLGSMVMWWNCMRFVGESGVHVGELEDLALTRTNWNGMERWGYIVVAPDPADKRPKPPRSAWLVRATPKGRLAQEVWRPLFGTIEKRWQERFGEGEIRQLRESLIAFIGQIDVELPDCLPILGYGLASKGSYPKRCARAGCVSDVERELPLPALLARVLLAFTIEFERESELSLAISANVLRVLDEKGLPVRDLPIRSGVSKEAIAVAMGFLQKRGIALIEPDRNGGRAKVARLTAKGQKAKLEFLHLLGIVEERWHARYGEEAVRTLCESLGPLVGEATAQNSPLFRALEPHPEGWRASVRKPETLPHYPMVLHRGGFPDGS